VPPYVPHQEINGSPNEICEAVVVRSGQEPVSLILTWKRRNLRARGIKGCRSIPAADTIAEVATVATPLPKNKDTKRAMRNEQP
jgi:hypothetical protein